MVGSVSAANAAKAPTLGAQRAQNAKYYLTAGGPTRIDAARVETHQGGEDDLVRFYYIPAGELCSGHTELGSPIDDATVKGHERGKLPHQKAAPPAQ